MSSKTWIIEWMQCKPTDGSLSDVVVTAGWRCNGVQDEHNATVYSTCSFPQPEAGQFIPYAELTEEQVLNWIWANGVDKDATEAAVQAQIDAAINPPITQPALPWAA